MMCAGVSIRRLAVSCVVVAASATACNRGPDKDDKSAASTKAPVGLRHIDTITYWCHCGLT